MKKHILIQLIAFFTIAAIFAQDKATKMDFLFNDLYKKGEINGAVLVEYKGEVIYKNAFGIANANWDYKGSFGLIDREGNPVDPMIQILLPDKN